MNKDQIKEKIKIKKWEFKNWCADKADKAKKFWDENKEYIVILTPVILATGERVFKAVRREAKLKEERELKEKFVYDFSQRCYYELKRKRTPSECLEIERRRRNGEPLAKILADMRLLK